MASNIRKTHFFEPKFDQFADGMSAKRLVWGKKRLWVTHVLEVLLLVLGGGTAVHAHLAGRQFFEIVSNNATKIGIDRNAHSIVDFENWIRGAELVGLVGHVLNGIIFLPRISKDDPQRTYRGPNVYVRVSCVRRFHEIPKMPDNPSSSASSPQPDRLDQRH